MSARLGKNAPRIIAKSTSKTALRVYYSPMGTTAEDARTCFNVDVQTCITEVTNILRLRNPPYNADFITFLLLEDVTIELPAEGTVLLGGQNAALAEITFTVGKTPLQDFTNLQDALNAVTGTDVNTVIEVYPGTYESGPVFASGISTCIRSAPCRDPEAVKFVLSPGLSDEPDTFVSLEGGSFVIEGVTFSAELTKYSSFENVLKLTGTNGSVVIRDCVVNAPKNTRALEVRHFENAVIENTSTGDSKVGIDVHECDDVVIRNCRLDACYREGISVRSVSHDMHRTVSLEGCTVSGGRRGVLLTIGNKTSISVTDCVIRDSKKHDLFVRVLVDKQCRWHPGTISVNNCEFLSDLEIPVRMQTEGAFETVIATVESTLILHQADNIFGRGIIGSIICPVGGRGRSGVVTKQYASFVTTDDATLPASAFLAGADAVVPDWVLRTDDGVTFEDITEEATVSRFLPSPGVEFLETATSSVCIGFSNATSVQSIMFENRSTDSTLSVSYGPGPTVPAVADGTFFVINTANAANNDTRPFFPQQQTIVFQKELANSPSTIDGKLATWFVISAQSAPTGNARSLAVRGVGAGVYYKTTRFPIYIGPSRQVVSLQTSPVSVPGSSGTTNTLYYGNRARSATVGNALAGGIYYSFTSVVPRGLDLTVGINVRVYCAAQFPGIVDFACTLGLVSDQDDMFTAPAAPVTFTELVVSGSFPMTETNKVLTLDFNFSAVTAFASTIKPEMFIVSVINQGSTAVYTILSSFILCHTYV